MTTDGASDGVFFGSAPNSAPGSPRNRIKFLCSHGGRILPRPPDGQLKYVGGETRVISVAPDISYQELMKKLTSLIDGEMILKYQPTSEDLDALVSVKSDEDVSFMCEEIKRCESGGNSRLRAFLFPANPISMENQMSTVDPPLEQRYIDAVNGITRPAAPKQHHLNSMQHGSRVSSGCSSPTSPDSWTAEAVSTNEPVLLPSNTYHHNGRMIGMHRVHSSPNICGSTMSANVPQQNHHFIHQLPPPLPLPQPQQQQQYFHHYPPGSGYQSSLKPHHDLPRNEGRLISVRSVGRADGVRYQLVEPPAPAPAPPPPRYYFTQMQGGNGCWHYDESNRFLAGRRFPERTSSQAMNPVHFRLGPGHTDSI